MCIRDSHQRGSRGSRPSRGSGDWRPEKIVLDQLLSPRVIGGDKLGDEFADQRPKHEPASPTGTEAQEPHEHALPPALRTPAQETTAGDAQSVFVGLNRPSGVGLETVSLVHEAFAHGPDTFGLPTGATSVVSNASTFGFMHGANV